MYNTTFTVRNVTQVRPKMQQFATSKTIEAAGDDEEMSPQVNFHNILGDVCDVKYSYESISYYAQKFVSDRELM